MEYEKRIKQLEKKYSNTNIQKGETLSKETRSKINKEYYDNQKRRLVDVVLNNVRNKDSVKEEVHTIVSEHNLNELCRQCRNETIIAIIILYCLKTKNSKYQMDRSQLWKRYNVDWRKYSLVIGRLLAKSREKKPIRIVEKDELIQW